MEVAERIAFLLNDMTLSMPTQDIEQSTNEILALLQESNAIEIFNQIISTNPNPKVRKSAYIYMRKIALANKNIEFAESVKDIFLHYFEIEKDLENLNQIINMIEPVADKIFKHSQWPQLTQVGLSLIQNPATILPGLQFFSTLYSYLPETDQRAIFGDLSNFAFQQAQLPHIEYRIAAYDLIGSLIFLSTGDDEEDDDDDPDTALLEKFPNISEFTLSIYTTALQNKDQREITEVNNFVSNLIFDRYSCFDDLAAEIFTQAVNIAKDTSIPVSLRLLILNILSESRDFYTDFFQEHLEEVFMTAITLSVEACSESREDPQFMDVAELIDSLSLIFDHESFYPTVMSMAGELASGNEAQVQVCLYMLSWIVKGCADDISDDPQQICEVIAQFLACEDSLIAYAAKTLLEEVSKHANNAITQHFDTLVNLLVQRCEDGDFLITLERVLFASEKAYSNPGELVEFLLGVASSEDSEYRDNAVECIATCLSKVTQIDESYFEGVYPVISGLLSDMSNPQLVTAVFKCIASLTKVSPQRTHESVGEIVQFMLGVMDQEEINVPACMAISDTLKTLISTYLGSFVEIAPELATRLMRLLQLEMPEHEFSDEPTEQEIEARDLSERQFYTMRQSSIISIAMMIEVIPQTIEDIIPSVIEMLDLMIRYPVNVEQMSASIAYKHAFPNIMRYGFDTEHFLTETLIPSIENQNSEFATAQLLRLLCHIISISPSTMTKQYAERIGGLLLSGFTGTLPIIKMNHGIKNIEESIIVQLVECTHRFILLMQEDFAQCIEQFYNAIAGWLGGRQNNLKGYAIRLFATMTTNFRDSYDIFDGAANFALQGLESNNATLKANSFSAFGFLIPANPQKVAPHAQTIIAACIQNMTPGQAPNDEVYQAALATWCTAAVIFGLQFTAEEASLYFQSLQFRGRKASDHIVAYAKFVCFCESHSIVVPQRATIAAIVLAASEFEIARLNEDRRSIISNIMVQHAAEIDTLTNMNQRKSQIIRSRLAGWGVQI